MSSDTHEGDVPAGLQANLEEVYEAYRHRHLQTRLDDIAATMEETLLQTTLARRLFDSSLSVRDSTQSKVTEARSYLQQGDVESLSAVIDDLETAVDEEHTRVENEIHELRIQKYQTATAMRQINEVISVADQDSLLALESLFDDWDWKAQVEFEEHDTFEDRQAAARTFGDDMFEVFVESKQTIVAGIDDETVQSLVESLLSDDRITLHELTPEQIEALTASELGRYIELSLGGQDN